MPLQISCPNCGKQLSARPELVGGKVACPRCATRFRIQPPTEEPEAVVYPPPNPDLYPPGAAPAAPAAAETAEAVPTSSPEKAPRRHTARFIERDVNATQIQLGANGQLPDLTLQSREKRTEAGESARSTHPLLLFGVLCVSVVMSVLILVIDEPQPGTSGSKEQARQTLERTFYSWDHADPPDPEVRDLLARALQAYNRGDGAQERRFYRQVMNRLNREDAPKYGGFTGDDETLKQALNELLR